MSKRNKSKLGSSSVPTSKINPDTVGKYYVEVDSAEEKAAVEGALKDIKAFHKSKIEEATKAANEITAKALKDAHESAEEQIATARRELLNAAEKDADKIKAEAKTQSEEFLSNAKKELEAAVEEHEKYTRMSVELTNQKQDYRHEALNDVQKEIDNITKDRDLFLNEITKLKAQCAELNQKNAELSGDLKGYENAFGDIESAREKSFNLEFEKNVLYGQLDMYKVHCNEKTNEVTQLMNKLLALGEDPEQTHVKLEYLQARVEELNTKLEEYPSNWEEIVQKSAERDAYLEKLNELNEKNLELHNQIFSLNLEHSELEDYRKFVKILELQMNELKAELDRIITQYEHCNEKVFPGLSKIDSDTFTKYKPKSVNLKTLCDNFRAYLNCRGSDRTSTKSSLYYDERTIRTFIAGFASSRTMIFEGLSGTGKTSLPLAFADYMGSVTDVVAVQSSWKDKNDLLGFYNDFKKQYTETDFLKYLYRASCDHDNIHLIVLDEMNLSRIEYYFADILSKLELTEGKRTVSLMPNASSIVESDESWPKRIHDGELEIPDNVWFIGTANKDDSTFTITDKVYDRSVVISFDSKGVPDKTLQSVGPTEIPYEDFKKALNETKWSENSKDREKFEEAIKYLDSLLKPFDITFGNRIYRQLETFVPAYMACGGDMKEAIDIMFSLKVIRKLEGLYDDKTKSLLNDLETNLKTMPLSQARVKILSSRIA